MLTLIPPEISYKDGYVESIYNPKEMVFNQNKV